MRRMPSAALAGLDPEQREAALTVRGPVCILAGAGTGKTRTITSRIAHAVATGAVPAGQLLAVTFTARAAGEMRGRLRELGVVGVQARTFHAAALRQLGYFWPRVVGGSPPQIVDSKLRLVGQACSRLGLPTDRTSLRDLSGEIEWAKATLVQPAGYAAAAAKAGRETPREPAQVAAVYEAYQAATSRAGLVDFEDLLLLTAAAIEDHRDVAEEVRSRYRHFVVDEYQDVNPLQQRLLEAWLGGRDDVCVVGDAAQTIYTFTGASPSYLIDFPRRYPGASVVRLERDYRSTPQVVTLANRVLEAGSAPAGTRLRLVGQRPNGPEPRFAEYDDEPAEAAAVAARCAALLAGGTPASEIAVLFRTNAQSEAYESALADAGVPYLVRGGERFFERSEIREALLLLRGAARSVPDDGVPLADTVRDVLAGAGWAAQNQPAGGAARERWESLAALVQLATDLDDGAGSVGVRELVADLEQRAAAQHAPTVQGVTLASLHAAKGLEWDAVFLVGLTEGTVPIVHADTPERIEEERRLLYVGITRAREHLQLSWALSRSTGGRRSRRPSRFLDGLSAATRRGRGFGPGGAGDAERPAGAGRRRARATASCRVCGRTLLGGSRTLGRCPTCPADRDEELFDRMRAWRAELARSTGVPAYVIFTDATLTALAERRPASAGELAQVPGVGPAKLDRYGADVLAMVRGEPGAQASPASEQPVIAGSAGVHPDRR